MIPSLDPRLVALFPSPDCTVWDDIADEDFSVHLIDEFTGVVLRDVMIEEEQVNWHGPEMDVHHTVSTAFRVPSLTDSGEFRPSAWSFTETTWRTGETPVTMEVSFGLPKVWRDALFKANTLFHETWRWQQDMASVVRNELGADLRAEDDVMMVPLTLMDPAMIDPRPVTEQLAEWRYEAALAVLHSLPRHLDARATAVLERAGWMPM